MINKEKNIKFVRNLTWTEVFEFWQKNESTNPDWINLAKEKGYNSWEEWRIESLAKPLKLQNTKWSLYEISNPTETILNFYGGLFSNWIKKHYDGEKTKTFRELSNRSDVIEKPYIQKLVKNYPANTKIICLKINDKIFIIEGMHRACALAIMNKKDKLDKKLYFAIGESLFTEKDFNEYYENLKSI